MAALVFDLGGTHLRCGISNARASLSNVKKSRIRSFIHGHSATTIWNDIINEIIDYHKEASSIVDRQSPIIISFPGPIAHPSSILSAPTLVGNNTEIPDLASAIKDLTGRNTYIINDLSAAAWYISNEIKDNRFMVVTVSSGIGSKLFCRCASDGVIDDVPFAGEIGHLVVDTTDNAMFCDCGGKGHLGAIASGRGVERFARIQAGKDKARFEKSACAKTFKGLPNNLTNEDHIIPAAKLHDEWIIDIIRQCCHPLAKILLGLTVAFGLDRIVVIGGFALSLEKIYGDILQKEMSQMCDYELLSGKISDLIMMGASDEEACLKGAAVFSLRI